MPKPMAREENPVKLNTHENLTSKGTMKRKITKMLVNHKKDGNTLVKTHGRPMLGFLYNEKVRGISN